ncbi:MAG TPA: amidohydrolase family protein [Hyphomicrobiaceae bacterium]|nr:amidohydrolase family protein [Hyphomicrobiaceae bacterium]
MSIFDEPKIDCHNHVFDPAGFPYQPDTPYRPGGQEIATARQFRHVMDCYGVRYGLVVGPNSGYSTDSRPVLDAIARSNGRCKGIAVVALDIATKDLAALKAQGIVGIAFNSTLDGVDYYLGAHDLLARLADLDMILQIQAEKDQLVDFRPLLDKSQVKLAIDHCGRPDISAGLQQPGFQTLLDLGRSRRACVKLSGYAKFSRRPHPHEDVQPFVAALLDAFTSDNCVWASDWPFVKATERIDYGPLLKLFEGLVPDPAERGKILWDTPRRWFGFGVQ